MVTSIISHNFTLFPSNRAQMPQPDSVPHFVEMIYKSGKKVHFLSLSFPLHNILWNRYHKFAENG